MPAGMARSATSRVTPAPSPSADRTSRSGRDSRYALTRLIGGESDAGRSATNVGRPFQGRLDRAGRARTRRWRKRRARGEFVPSTSLSDKLLQGDRREAVLVRVGSQREPAAEGRIGGGDNEDGRQRGRVVGGGAPARIAHPLHELPAKL